MNVHKRTHTVNTKILCEVCGTKFTNMEYLVEHKRVHTEERIPFVGEESGIEFSHKPHLEHLKSHLKPLQESDNDDEKLFSSTEIEGPERPSTINGEFECDVCGKKFIRKEYLAKHMRVHMGEKLFSGQECKMEFAQNPHLQQHQKNHLKLRKETDLTDKKRFSCNECQSKFSRKSALNVHRRNHTGEIKFICDICGTNFTRKEYLVKHIRVHTGNFETVEFVCTLKHNFFCIAGEKPFGCAECKMQFSQKSQLERHRILHQKSDFKLQKETKRFSCDECESNFSRRSALNVHKRTHTGDGKFVCDYCGTKFTRKEYLERHKRVHTGTICTFII